MVIIYFVMHDSFVRLVVFQDLVEDHQWPTLLGAEWAGEGLVPNGIMNAGKTI